MTLAVLAPGTHAVAFGAALVLRARRSGPVGLVTLEPAATSPPVPAPGPPPTLAAARIASGLRRSGHPGRAHWRLVRCDAADAAEAAHALGLLDESCAAVALAVSAPIDDLIEAVLTRCASVAVGAVDGPALAAIGPAVGSLREKGMPAFAIDLPDVGIATVLATSGIGAPPGWIGPIDDLLSRVGGNVASS